MDDPGPPVLDDENRGPDRPRSCPGNANKSRTHRRWRVWGGGAVPLFGPGASGASPSSMARRSEEKGPMDSLVIEARGWLAGKSTMMLDYR